MNASGIAKKLLMFVCALAVAAVGVVGLSACGTSEEDKVKASLTEALDLVKSADLDEMEKVSGEDIESEFSSLEELGIEAEDIIASLVSRYDYTINDVSIDGDTGTASLTVTNIDFTTAIANYITAVTEFSSSSEASELYQSDGLDAFYKKIGELFMDELNDTSLGTITEDVEVAIEKDSDGNWDFADSSDSVKIIFPGLDTSSLSSLFS